MARVRAARVKRSPITKQRSPWIEDNRLAAPIPGVPARAFRRRTHDGTLWAIVNELPESGWHMSISFRNVKNEPSRYPTWDEIAHGRDELLPAEVHFVMHLPSSSEVYVAHHPTTFHLHEYPPREA